MLIALKFTSNGKHFLCKDSLNRFIIPAHPKISVLGIYCLANLKGCKLNVYNKDGISWVMFILTYLITFNSITEGDPSAEAYLQETFH